MRLDNHSVRSHRFEAPATERPSKAKRGLHASQNPTGRQRDRSAPPDLGAPDDGPAAVAAAVALTGQRSGHDLIGIRTRGASFLQPGERVTGTLTRKTERGRPVTRIELPDGRSFKLSPKDAAGVPTGGRISLVHQHKRGLAIDPKGTDAVTSFVGRLQKDGRAWVAVSSDASAALTRLPVADAGGAKAGDAVLVHVTDGLTHRRRGDVQDILTDDQPWKHTFTKLAVDAGVEATFGPRVADDIRRIRATFDPDRIEGYRDLSDKYFFSIDNPYSKDFDQAMCIEPNPSDPSAHDVYYAIADLDYFLQLAGPDSALAQRARRVQTTTYMPGMDFPVLPRALSEDLCSLNEGKKRPALVIKYTVDADGRVKQPEFIDGIVVNRKNGNYPEAQAHLDGEPVADPRYARGIEDLKAVGGRLLSRAKARGMFMSSGGEQWATIDSKTGELKSEHRGQLWIEDANAQISIAAGRTVGRYLIDNGAPAFHRRHEAPDPERVERCRNTVRAMGVKWPRNASPQAFADQVDTSTAKGRAIHRLLLHCMPRAFVAAEPGAHEGLKVAQYVQSTAPMRRTRDAGNHAWIRDVREGRTPDLSQRDEIVDRAHAADVRSRKLDREVRRRLAADALARTTGQRLDAQVVDISPWGVNLYFPALNIEYRASAESLGAQRLQLVQQNTAAKVGALRFERGQTVSARVLDAEPHDGVVRFQFEGAVSKAERAREKGRGPRPTAHPLTDVRGDGFESPLVGENVQTRGVVTAVNGVGFFIQPEDAPAHETTGGLLVRTRHTSGIRPGDVVDVQGRVHEQRSRNAPYDRSVVEIVKSRAKVVGRTDVPEPVTISGLEGPEIPADPKAAVEYWRRLLGQRVEVPPGVAVAPSNRFGDLAVVPDEWSPKGALRTPEGGVVMPDGEWNHQVVGLKFRRHIGAPPSVAVGDRIDGAEGVVIYRSGSFQVELSKPPRVTAQPPRPAASTRLVAEPGKTTVAGVNVLNLHPGETKRAEALARQIVEGLRSPDVIAVQEIQDNDGPKKSEIVDADETYEMLIEKIRAAGGPAYEWFDIPPVNNQDGGEPGGNIRNGFLFRPDRARVIKDSVERIGIGNPAFDNSRKSLAAEFEVEGRKLLIVNNHLASRRGSSPWTADLDTPVIGKADQRLGQAEAVRAYVDARQAEDPTLEVLLVGDMNDGPSSPTVAALAEGGFRDFTRDVPADQRFDYNYRGTLQVLQPVLGSRGLKGRTEIEFVHDSVFNGITGSDHDPVVVRVDFTKNES